MFFNDNMRNMHNGIIVGLAAFTPKSRGLYTIEVTKEDHPINGSPFKINVGDNQISNAAHVQLSGNCMKQGKANELNEIPIDISKAGMYLELLSYLRACVVATAPSQSLMA